MHHFRNANEGLFWLNYGVFLEKDEKGGGSSDSDKDDTDVDDTDKDDSTKNKDKAKDKDVDEDDKPVYSKKKVTDLIAKRLDEDRKKRKEETDKQALIEKENYKGLHEASEAKLKELTPKAELADKLVEISNKSIDVRIAKWPDEIKDMDPGPENIEARIAWVEKADKAVKRIEKTGPVNGENGKQGDSTKNVDSLFAKMQNPGNYAIPGQKKT
jgi:hypothetical protein